MTEPQAITSRHRLTELLSGRFMRQLDALDVFSRKVLHGKLQGERRSKRRGQSVEFADHRPYVVGDDLRFVDWNVYGRLDQLFIKLFLEELDLSLHVLVDVSASMGTGEPRKALIAKRLAAALCYIGLVNNNRVTLTTFADGVVGQVGNMRGRGYLSQMAELLLDGDDGEKSSLERTARQVVTSQAPGVMIVLSDMLLKDGYEDALRRIIGRKYDLYVIQILSPEELEPTFTGDLKLVDAEDGDEAEVTISASLLDFYKKSVNAYCKQLNDFCTSRGATYMLTNSAEPIEPLVLNYLRKAGLLR